MPRTVVREPYMPTPALRTSASPAAVRIHRVGLDTPLNVRRDRLARRRFSSRPQRAGYNGIRAVIARGYVFVFEVGRAATGAAATASPLGCTGGIACGDEFDGGAAVVGLGCAGGGLGGRFPVGAGLGATVPTEVPEGAPDLGAGACAPSPAFVPCTECAAGALSGGLEASRDCSDPECSDPDCFVVRFCATGVLSACAFCAAVVCRALLRATVRAFRAAAVCGAGNWSTATVATFTTEGSSRSFT